MGDIIALLFFGWLVWRIKNKAQNMRSSMSKQTYGGPPMVEGNTAAEGGSQRLGGNPQPSATAYPDLFRERARPTLEEYTGSLGVATMEGRDLCDPALGHSRERPERILQEAEPVEACHVLPLPLTGDAIVQGFVMGEILARPSHRKWGNR